VKGGKKIMYRGEQYQPVTFTTEKNKNAVSGFEATIFLKLGHGFDPASDIMAFLVLTGFGRYAKESKRNVFVVDEDFTKLSKSTHELHGSMPVLEFETNIREDEAFRTAFFAAAQELIIGGVAFPRMQQHRINTEIEKERKAKEKKARIDAGEEVEEEAPKKGKGKKGKKASPAALAAEEPDEPEEEEEAAEFTFEDVVSSDEDDTDAAA
jgi:hypothetical protein